MIREIGESEKLAIKFLSKTGKYKITKRLINESESELKLGYHRYFRYEMHSENNEKLATYFVPYGPIPSEFEKFMDQFSLEMF